MQKIIIGGVYKHYKGKTYFVLGVAKHSETLEDLVVYVPRYESEMASLWVRPLSMFLEDVTIDGIRQPRFRYIGMTYEVDQK